MKFIDKIFFYGSLKSDGPFYELYSRNVINIESACIYGKLAIYKKLFPALLEDDESLVYGELVTFFNLSKMLTMLDSVETYLERTEKCVFIKDEDSNYNECVTAWVYIYKGSEHYLQPLDKNSWSNIDLKL